MMKSQKGQLLIELLIAVGVAAIFLPILLSGLVSSRDGKAQQKQRLEGLTILKEAQDATRSVREKGWAEFAVANTYFPLEVNSSWTLATGSSTLNGFTRQVVISDVQRDNNGVIVTSNGTVDPSTKKVVITISWTKPYASSVSSTEYYTRFLDSASYIETTQNQFNFVGSANPGVKTGLTVRSTGGSPTDGEVILGSGGSSDWCYPSLLASGGAVLDMPGQGYPSTITAIEGKAFMGTGENASGLSFMSAMISNTHPPVATPGNTYDGHKTNGVFGETNYGYITTDTNSREVVVVDISGGTYALSTYFNAPGNGSGKAIFVVGNTGYMTSGNKLYNFDLTNKNDPDNSRPIIDNDGFTLAGAGVDIYIVGNYAYVATGSTANQLQIIDISNPSDLILAGQTGVNGLAAKSIYVSSDGNRVYLATAQSSTQKEFFILDTSTKSNPSVITGGVWDTSPMDPTGVTVVPGNRVIIVGHEGKEYQVINVQKESLPFKCGEEDIDAGINDVASILEADGDAYSYIMTGDANKEFQILEGGPGGSYASSGIYESATFDPGYMTANNRLSATYSVPSGTSIEFQVSMATPTGNPSVCPSSGNYTFVGPSGTESDYFTPYSGQAITFPFGSYQLYTNPGQCFRYKVFFSTTNTSSTPVLNDVTINYAP